MHDAGAEGVATSGESLTAAEEGVDQGAARGAGTGVHGHAGGLVDGNDVVVFVKDVESNGLGFDAQRGAGLDLDLDALPGAEAVRTFGWAGIDEHKAGFDEFLDASAADVAEARSDLLVESLPCFAFGSDEFMNRGLVALSHAVIVAAPVNCALDPPWSKEHGQNWMWRRGNELIPLSWLAVC
jgi:hypothetical protein